jgi:cytochrome P450
MVEVLNNNADFSSAIAPQGPATPLPFTPQGSDITAQIEAHRQAFHGGDLLVALDDVRHGFSRSILTSLFTPSRLKANEAFMEVYADRLVREMVARGSCDLIRDVATPFVTHVIADLLGVPADDRLVFMQVIEEGVGAGSLDGENLAQQNQPLEVMAGYFIHYVTDRRANPREDVLTELSLATYPDGTTPDAMEIVRLSTFLFGAGQDTSAKLLGNAMRFLIDQPGLQETLRADPSRIPAFLEEVLRLEGSSKITARLARRDTQIAGMAIPAGTRVLLALSAANRDPRRWDDPAELKLGRPRIREHLGFGRGAHTCIGGPLARVEVRVILEKFLEYTAHIDMSEAAHGPRGQRRLDFEPSFIIRGLSQLQLELTPTQGFTVAQSEHATA